MTIQVETKDCTALSDAELQGLGICRNPNGRDFQQFLLQVNAADWGLPTCRFSTGAF